MKVKTYKYFTIQDIAAIGNWPYYEIRSRDKSCLGGISWYAPWKQYCFFPADGTVWSADCLANVQEFLVELNKENKG